MAQLGDLRHGLLVGYRCDDMRPESSIVEMGEIASGVAIAAFVIVRSLIQVAARTSDRLAGVPAASCTRHVL